MRQYAHTSILAIIIILGINSTYSQNMVPNPSFEEYSECPSDYNQISLAKDWIQLLGREGEYFNTCSKSPFTNPKLNSMGRQQPAEGKAYIGSVFYTKNKKRYSEVAFCMLKEPMFYGDYYKVSFYVSLADLSSFNLEEIGVYFTEVYPKNYLNYPYLTRQSFIMKNKSIFNTDSWVLVYGLFKATGGENYMTISRPEYGQKSKENFRKIKKFNGAEKGGLCYVLIDDIEVTKAESEFDTSFAQRTPAKKMKLDSIEQSTICDLEFVFRIGSTKYIKNKDLRKTYEINPDFINPFWAIGSFAHFYKNTNNLRVDLSLSTDEPAGSKKYQLARERLLKLKQRIEKENKSNTIKAALVDCSENNPGVLSAVVHFLEK